jgi:hypothetical protein
MPYALVPDGYTLKKVNKGELEAINRHNRALAIRRFTGSRNSSVIFIVAAAVGFSFLFKQIKIPGFDVLGSFAQAFPQLSAALGVSGKLTPEQSAKIDSLFREGAGPDASTLMKLFFPTPEERAAKKAEKETTFRKYGI